MISIIEYLMLISFLGSCFIMYLVYRDVGNVDMSMVDI